VEVSEMMKSSKQPTNTVYHYILQQLDTSCT